MARIEDLEDVGYRVKYDDNGTVVGIVGNRGEPSPFVLATTNKLTGGLEFSYDLGRNPSVPTGAFNIFSASDFAAITAGMSAGLTAEVDYSTLFAGQPTIKITVPAGTSGSKNWLGTVGLEARLPESWDGKDLCCAVMSTNLAAMMPSLAMYIGDATYANHWMKDQGRAGHPDGNTWFVQNNEWRIWKVGTTEATAIPVGGGSPVAARRMRARISSAVTASAATETVWIGFFGVMPKRKKPTFVITLDDGYSTWFDFVAPLARYYDIPVSMGIIGGLVLDDPSNKMSKSQCRALASDKSGLFDLVNHSYDHLYLTDAGNNLLVDEDVWIENFKKNRDFLRNEIGVTGDGPNHVMYPGGRCTYSGYPKLRAAGFLTGRKTNYGWQNGQDQTMATEDLGRYVLSVLTPMEEVGLSVAAVKSLIDASILRNEFAILQGHNFDATSQTNTWSYENLEQIFAYLAQLRAAGTIEIKSWTKWYADLTGRPCAAR